MISAFAFMRLVSALSSGRLVNRIGERLVLALGIGIVAISSALAGLSQTYTQLLVLRGVGGVGSAMFTVSAVSLLLRVVDADQRGRATGMWQSGFLVGAIAGPAIGGPLTDISLRAPFFVYAVTLAVAGSIALVFLRRVSLHDLDPAAQKAPTVTLPQALRVSGYRAALMTNLGNGWALFGVRSSLIPLFVTEGIGPQAPGSASGSSSRQPPRVAAAVGRRTRRPDRPPAGDDPGPAVATTSMAVVAVSDSLVVYTIAMALFGAGSAFLWSRRAQQSATSPPAAAAP